MEGLAFIELNVLGQMLPPPSPSSQIFSNKFGKKRGKWVKIGENYQFFFGGGGIFFSKFKVTMREKFILHV